MTSTLLKKTGQLYCRLYPSLGLFDVSLGMDSDYASLVGLWYWFLLYSVRWWAILIYPIADGIFWVLGAQPQAFYLSHRQSRNLHCTCDCTMHFFTGTWWEKVVWFLDTFSTRVSSSEAMGLQTTHTKITVHSLHDGNKQSCTLHVLWELSCFNRDRITLTQNTQGRQK